MVQASLARVTARLTKQLGDKRRALAASSIQNFWRCVHPKVKLRRVRIHQSLGRALHTRQQNAAQTIGRAIRGWAIRVRHKRLNKSTRALQAVVRRNNVYCRIKKEISALLIQRFCHRIWLRIAIRRHLILLAFGRDPKNSSTQCGCCCATKAQGTMVQTPLSGRCEIRGCDTSGKTSS
jgi:predicted membrane metal-binding protein